MTTLIRCSFAALFLAYCSSYADIRMSDLQYHVFGSNPDRNVGGELNHLFRATGPALPG